jgi:hypothetical protein
LEACAEAVVVTCLVACAGAFFGACSSGPKPNHTIDATISEGCGNGVREEDEACDGADLGEMTCWAQAGLLEGTLTCTADCTFDTADCHTCGDRVLQGPEECDGINLGGRACTDLGFGGGVLACDSDCTYDTGACTSTVSGWYDEQWAFRLPLQIEYLRVSADLHDFTVPVVMSGLDLAGKIQPLGEDFVFTEADGRTPLPHEIEHVDGDRGILVAWVRFGFVSASEHTDFYLYYGNPSCTNMENPSNVWDVDHLAVWHLGEATVDGELGTGHFDSTIHGLYGTQYGNHRVEGIVGYGQYFDGGGDYIKIDGPAAVVLGDAGCTVSAWIRTGRQTAMGLLIKSANGLHEDGDKLIGLNHDAGKLGVDHGGAAGGYLASTLSVTDSGWHHVAWTQSKDATAQAEHWQLYIDGQPDASTSVVTLPDVADHSLHLGGLAADSKFPTRFEGWIDEVRISNTPRSAAWLKAQYESVRDASGFVSAGLEEPRR